MQVIGRFRDNEDGATAIEFSVVAFTFFMLMFGIIEYGMIMLTQIAIESATQQVARESSLGKPTAPGCDRACEVTNLIEQKTGGLIRSNTVRVTTSVVTDQTVSTPPIPDICLLDPDDPYPESCPPDNAWQENNGTPGYQQPAELTEDDLGKSSEVVEIRVTYLWNVLFPIFREHFGDHGVMTISAATVIRNEPYEEN